MHYISSLSTYKDMTLVILTHSLRSLFPLFWFTPISISMVVISPIKKKLDCTNSILLLLFKTKLLQNILCIDLLIFFPFILFWTPTPAPQKLLLWRSPMQFVLLNPTTSSQTSSSLNYYQHLTWLVTFSSLKHFYLCPEYHTSLVFFLLCSFAISFALPPHIPFLTFVL